MQTSMSPIQMNETIKDYCRWNVPHPIPYQGSKRGLAPVILTYFPAHFRRLVEPFAGSAAISLATAYKGLANQFLVNDAHGPLGDLWHAIVEHPAELADEYEHLWHDQNGRERSYYDLVRKKFNAGHKPAHFLYLLARCVKAVIRYNREGQFNNSPDNRRKGARPETMRKRIMGASDLLRRRTEIFALDYKEILASCGSSDVIYMDPPYQGVGGARDQRYCPKVIHSEFCDCLATLNDKGCMYVVSYDGRMGNKTYGEPMPDTLALAKIEIHAGRSSQATLLGIKKETYESLYISPALARVAPVGKKHRDRQQQFAW